MEMSGAATSGTLGYHLQAYLTLILSLTLTPPIQPILIMFASRPNPSPTGKRLPPDYHRTLCFIFLTSCTGSSQASFFLTFHRIIAGLFVVFGAETGRHHHLRQHGRAKPKQCNAIQYGSEQIWSPPSNSSMLELLNSLPRPSQCPMGRAGPSRQNDSSRGWCSSSLWS